MYHTTKLVSIPISYQHPPYLADALLEASESAREDIEESFPASGDLPPPPAERTVAPPAVEPVAGADLSIINTLGLVDEGVGAAAKLTGGLLLTAAQMTKAADLAKIIKSTYAALCAAAGTEATEADTQQQVFAIAETLASLTTLTEDEVTPDKTASCQAWPCAESWPG